MKLVAIDVISNKEETYYFILIIVFFFIYKACNVVAIVKRIRNILCVFCV